MTVKKTKYYHIASLEKGMRVLELLADQKALTVSETARHLGLNRASSHRFLAHLADLGYVEKDENNRYQLTLKLLAMGNKAARRFEIRQVSLPYMQRLFVTYREAINLGYLNGVEILHLSKIDNTDILGIDTPLGSSAPAYCTALGKAILSQMSTEELKRYLTRVRLEPHGPKTILSNSHLRKELQQTHLQGYAVDDEELSPGLRCVAAPVFDHTNSARYAISISGPIARMTSERIEELQKDLRETCSQLSQRMGWNLQ